MLKKFLKEIIVSIAGKQAETIIDLLDGKKYINEFIKADINKKMDQIYHQIKSRETKEFYICPKCNIEFNEENALIHNFACNECGEIMSRKDNAPVIKEYNKEIDKLRKELGFVDEELKIEREKQKKNEFFWNFFQKV